jgi:hypothetical protein
MNKISVDKTVRGPMKDPEATVDKSSVRYLASKTTPGMSID